MLLLWPCLLLATASAHRVVESIEDQPQTSTLRKKIDIQSPPPASKQRVDIPSLPPPLKRKVRREERTHLKQTVDILPSSLRLRKREDNPSSPSPLKQNVDHTSFPSPMTKIMDIGVPSLLLKQRVDVPSLPLKQRVDNLFLPSPMKRSVDTPSLPSAPFINSRVDSLNSTALYPVNKTEGHKIKSATSWKVETTFGEPKLESNATESKEEVAVERPENKSASSSEFRASQHLGNFVDEDSLEAGGGHRPTHDPGAHHHFEGFGRERPTHAPLGDFAGVIRKPPTGFIHSLKEHKFPKESFKHYDFPYKLESPILTKTKDGWKPTAPALESHPTDESPVRVPAGGLYSLPDPFKIKPGTTDEDFGLEFSHDAKEHAIKKPRVNPWKNILHLITALIPVGIIVSALTPNVITIEPQPNNPFRRADSPLTHLPPISERCRRRLLCELQSEASYSYPSNLSSRNKKCYRLRCDDPDGLSRTLQWLLSHQRPNSGPTAGIKQLPYPRPLESPYYGLGPTGDQWDLKIR